MENIISTDQRVPKAYLKYVKGKETQNAYEALKDGIKYQFGHNYQVGAGGVLKESSKKAKRTKPTESEIKQRKREENYKNLTKHLKNKGEKLKYDEFRAVLSVLNKIEVNEMDEKEAVELTSVEFDVKKAFLMKQLKNIKVK